MEGQQLFEPIYCSEKQMLRDFACKCFYEIFMRNEYKESYLCQHGLFDAMYLDFVGLSFSQ